MKISICDDSLEMLNMLKEWMEEFMEGFEYEIQLYDNGIDLIYEIEHTDGVAPQIIFMDIKLKNDNGIDVAKVIKKYNEEAVIIFISGYSEYFEESFEAEPTYFLVKPLKKESFTKAMEKAFEKMNCQDRRYLILRKKEVIRIPLDHILYIESEGRKIHINCQKETLTYYEKLDCLEDQLKGEFVRCHKSYLVNMKWVRRVDSKLIFLTNGTEIPVSRNKLMETKDKVFEYFGRQLR